MPQPSFADFLERRRQARLDSYKSYRADVTAHTNSENRILNDGYEARQIIELVQNGADAISDGSQEQVGRICVSLLNETLYVANTGSPFTEEGVESLLNIDYSPKRKNEIGRYGLGFKSLLKLGGQVDVLSTSGSLQLDPTRCQCEIRKLLDLPEDHLSPRFRLAWPVGRRDEASRDRVLEEFAWATTVVRAKIADDSFPQTLRREIREFPSEFLLFLAADVILELNDGDGPPRVLRRESDGEDFILHDGENSSRWRVLQRQVRISDEKARADGGDLHRRDSVPLAWAVPLDAKRDIAGYFWAFFPTQTPSRLPGILNAPWKLSSGREHLADRSPWNEALMLEAASLVVENLPSFSHQEDPGHILDLLPRKHRQGQSEIAAPLVSSVLTKLKDTEIVPDGNGKLRQATELKLPPLDASKQDWVALHAKWERQASDEIKSHWVHSTCLDPNRVSRLKELERDKVIGKSSYSVQAVGVSAVDSWLGAIASATAEEAKVVLSLADSYAQMRESHAWRQEKSSLAIIPTQSGRLCRPSEVILGPPVPGKESVLAALTESEDAVKILRDVLGVVSLDDDGWRSLLNDALKAGTWENLWSTLRQSPVEIRDRFTADCRDSIRVPRRDGQWVRYDAVLLPGHIVPEGDSELANLAILLDDNCDIELAKQVGVSDCPSGNWGPEDYGTAVGDSKKLLRDWLRAERRSYKAVNTSSSTPQDEYLEPFSLSMPKGWILLERLRGNASAALTRHLMNQLPALAEVPFGHCTRPDAYPKIKVSHPLRWYLKQYGTIAIGSSYLPLRVFLACRGRKVLERIPAWKEIEPFLKSLDGDDTGGEPRTDDIRRFWQAIFTCIATPDAIDSDTLRAAWSEAAQDKQVPEYLCTAEGEVPLAKVYVTSSASLAQRARSQGKTAVSLDAEAMVLWLENDAQALDALLKLDWSEIVSERISLDNAIPELTEFLYDAAKPVAWLQNVRGLRISIGGTSEQVPCLQADGVLYRDPDQFQLMSRVEQMRTILDEVAAAGWLCVPLERAVSEIANAGLNQRRAWIAAGTTLEEKLLRAVGERSEPLRAAIGDAARAIPHDCPPMELARLTMALHGPAILQKLRETLNSEGLKPPGKWGSAKARAFVAELGFPEDFAVSSESRREAETYMTGPIPLGNLHEYQERVIEGLEPLLTSGSGRRRAVVSLPTGAGKTRVAVEAAVKLVLNPCEGNRLVLWVAQTDELCEQAVQAFRQIWLSHGAERTDLRIVRFWSGNPTPVAPEKNQPTVVVASIQTLDSRMGKEEMNWLSKPGLVILDECHHAISPSYTSLLRWLDAEARRPGSLPKDEPPIIGLSATPLRANDEESERLAKRFDGHYFPQDQENLYVQLTECGVLAEIINEALPSPAAPPQNLLDLLDYGGDTIASENQLDELNRWLAKDEDRNRRLIEVIQASNEKHILFFANSVAHAEEMALRMNLSGILAAPISGDTASSTRRHFLKKFQDGEIRVLCNHSVLTTGFDAPKTDMVLISRVVRSQVRYMQMVGRGLRGTKNGGTENCRIVTMLDNLGQYSNLHPYYVWAKYFDGMTR
jgi:superfamily II DNA or RNA helicase